MIRTVQWEYEAEHEADPTDRSLAELSLDLAAALMLNSGLLDILITRAAKLKTAA